MKILHVITTIERGGAENQLVLLSEYQTMLNHEVFIVYLKGSPDLKDEIETHGTKIISDLCDKNSITQIFKLKLLLKKIKPDIVHAHLPQAELVCSFSLNYDSHYVISRHFGGQFYPKVHQKISSLLGRIASRKAKVVIAISKSVKDMLVSNKEIAHPDSIKVVHYGFSKKRFLNQNLATNFLATSSASKNVKIGTVARLSPEKDLQTLIKAVAILRKIVPNIELKIAGSGSEEESLKKLCKEFGIDENVFFLGKIREVPSFLKSLDLFVLTSKFEGFGMVLLEAMAARSRIVAARNSAIVEVLGQSGAGIFFETSNEMDLAKKIEKNLHVSGRSYLIEQRNQLNKFTIEIMGNKIDKIYNLAI
jgi:glycosyltransferase involved in cell wall biosynthesis